MTRSLALRAAAALVCASALAVSATTAHAQVAPAPQFLLEFGAAGSGTTPLAGGHQNEQVAVDADGNVWVADKGNDRVVKFDYNGAFIVEVRTAGPGRGAFDAPEGVTADAEGFVYVADTLNDRIVKLTTGGTTAAVFATELPSANPAAEPRTPTSLAIDGAGRLYVQAAGGVIRLASADGRRLGVFTAESGTSVAVDKAGNVWTTQLTATGSQLVKFRPDGTKAGEFGSPEPIGGLNGQTARGVAVHPSGVIHVADFRGGVQRYTADGAYIDRYPADSALPPNGPLSLYIATSAAIDCRGNVYVVNADYPDTARVTVAKFGDPAAEPPPCAPRPLPAGDIDVQVNDVEVTQGVQDLRTFTANRSPAGALAVPDYGNAASYGPTVPLAESRTTVVRAYAALRRGPAGGLANVPATLEATQRVGGVTTHRGPLAPVSQPSVLRVGGTTVDPAQRANPAGAYTFLVPTGWTRGDVDFVVQVNPSHQGCAGACQARSRFQLANVAFRRVAPVTVFPLALTIRPTNVPVSYPGALPVMPGVGTLADPGPAFDRARVLSPAPINLFPWVGRVEVGDLVRATSFVEESCFLGIELGLLCQKENKDANREIRQGQVMERVERWVDDNNVGDDVVTMGLISDAHPDLPGAMLHNLKDDDDSPFGYAAVHRPITAVAHELQHALGRQHAGTLPVCYPKKEQLGASWPPDEQGFLQGIGLDPRLGSGGGRGPFAVLYPGANGGPGQWFDLMSYCAAGDGDTWTSPRGWREIMDFRGATATAASRFRTRHLARLAPAGRVLRVAAIAAADGTLTLSGVSPGTGPAEAGDPGSPFILETRDAAGRQVLASARMDPEQLDDGGGTMLSGEIPAAGAAMVVVRREGGDRAVRRMRSANAPRVRLLNPRAGAREGGAGAVTVRWRANDADGDRLVATVQYSANRGRNWRTVHLGGSTGGLRLAAGELAPSRRAQVRVRVDDGFDEAVATSRVFTVLAAAPQARILEPVRGARVREGAPVILRAEASAAGRPLAGRALRWFDRRRALGTGQTLTLPRLDAGRRTIRLVATAGGRRTVRTVAISVAGVRPAFLVLSGPLRLSPRARNARLRVATTATATLSAGGRRFPVGPRARTLTIPIRPANRPLRLALELRGAGGRTRTTLTIPRR